MTEANESPLQSIRDDALSLAHALNLVVEAYVHPYPLPFPEDKRRALAEAAYEAARALGNHSRLKRLYKTPSD
jgi:hypothetical protein